MGQLALRVSRSTARLSRLAAILGLFAAPASLAEAQTDRFSAGGYYRIMTRPDFAGGNSRLGIWNLYGRLLNEGPYGMLQLQLNVLQSEPEQRQPWAQVNARIEGGSFQSADQAGGTLASFKVSQLYVQAGNVLLDNVVFKVGTLWFYPGDLGLYDVRPAELFYDTVGLSGMTIFNSMITGIPLESTPNISMAFSPSGDR